MDAHMTVVAPTFLFDDRKRFDAQCEHDRIRSSLLSELDTPTTADPWKQRPIDFTMKNFHPNRKRVSKEPSSSGSSARERPSQISRNPDPTVMEPFGLSYQNGAKTSHRSDEDDDSDFELDTRVKYDRIARMLNTEQYKNPKLHDFRQVVFVFVVSRVFTSLFHLVSWPQRTRFARVSNQVQPRSLQHSVSLRSFEYE